LHLHRLLSHQTRRLTDIGLGSRDGTAAFDGIFRIDIHRGIDGHRARLLGGDLNFRGTRINRGLALVEVLAGQRRCVRAVVLGEQRVGNPIRIERLAQERQSIGSQRARFARRRQHAQIRDLERRQLEL
jgi:hypothetical protein